MTNLSIKAGIIEQKDLAQWLMSNNFKEWVQGRNVHAVLEYMHRFHFTDRDGLFGDLNKGEIAQFGLRSRVFWDKGQIEWRRTDKGTFTLLALIENGQVPFPQELQLTQEDLPSADGVQEDTTMVLWGTYNDDMGDFLEKRVSGSQPIQYPSSLKNGKTYPVLWIRIYKNKEGEQAFWRFTRPDAMNLEDWKEGGKINAEKTGW